MFYKHNMQMYGSFKELFHDQTVTVEINVQLIRTMTHELK